MATEEKKPKNKPSFSVFIHNPEYRQQRKLQLLAYVYEECKENEKMEGNDGSLKKEQVVGLWSFQWGLSCRAVETYLKELQSIGAIVERRDRIKATDIAKMLLTKSE